MKKLRLEARDVQEVGQRWLCGWFLFQNSGGENLAVPIRNVIHHSCQNKKITPDIPSGKGG